MRLSWNEIRVRAKAFSDRWKNASYEKGETQTFYNEFFDIFGLSRTSVGSYEMAVKKLGGGQGFIDLFWPGTLLVEQKSAGRDLGKAEFQAMDYIHALKDQEKPRYVLLSDFQTFKLIDLHDRDALEFSLTELHKHVQKFGFMIGVERREFKDQDPVNIKASYLVGRLHDALEEGGFDKHDLEVFLVQIVFCLFADDTGVFQPKDLFLRFLEDRTSEDGSDLGPKLAQLFQTLDTPEDKRSKNLDEDLAAFPYVNGRLFERHTRIPSFDSGMREKLIEASRFDWSPISPAIFGALFQSVMDSKQRREKGAHYTTEKNILKVIGPLFMDELRAEFDRAKDLKRGREAALTALQDKLASLTFFDPACGCGNFLIIAYRELRILEIDILKAKLGKAQLELDASVLSKIDVDQFYGIELEEFPARIAETAMWMMDHIMNNALSLAFGQNYARIPLDKAANIVHGDALEVDWETVLPAVDCSYVFGNPPFSGFALRNEEKKSQALAMRKFGANGGRMDYVCFWFLKAGDYILNSGVNPAKIAFVSTNSIVQGEQVEQLWPSLFERYQLEISFAHRTFAWGSDARGKAQVHCVIIGLSHRSNQPEYKRLFSYDKVGGEPEETQCRYLSPYLFDASGLKQRHLVVKRDRNPTAAISKIRVGTKPVDGGGYIFSNSQVDDICKMEPNLRKYFRPFIGAHELINGGERNLFCPSLMSQNEIKQSKIAREIIKSVKEIRLKGGSLSKKLAETPTKFHVTVIPDRPFLALPETSSERRTYFPIAWLTPPTIPSNACLVIESEEIHYFSVLTSATHMAWLGNIGGRLKNDYRYSSGLVYNTFPWPNLSDEGKTILIKTGQAILDARAEHSDVELAQMYDPDYMPISLLNAHKANDKAVDRLYRKEPFQSERERVEHLFMLYEQLQSPILAAAKPKPKKRKARTVRTS